MSPKVLTTWLHQPSWLKKQTGPSAILPVLRLAKPGLVEFYKWWAFWLPLHIWQSTELLIKCYMPWNKHWVSRSMPRQSQPPSDTTFPRSGHSRGDSTIPESVIKCKFNLILQENVSRLYISMNCTHGVIRSSCCDADDKRWVRACRGRRIECPIKSSNCPTNVGLNNISQLILLTDGLIAHKINLGDKSSHRCPVWAIRQSYFGG